jgi:hypothetical protein
MKPTLGRTQQKISGIRSILRIYNKRIKGLEEPIDEIAEALIGIYRAIALLWFFVFVAIGIALA